MHVYHTNIFLNLCRDVSVLLTENRLWMVRSPDPECCLSYIELDASALVDIRDDSTNVFALTDSQRTAHAFRARSHADALVWVDAVKDRTVMCSENDIIMMAEDCCARGEMNASSRDEELLLGCSSFEGTLENRLGGNPHRI